MATELIELGATELIEIGRVNTTDPLRRVRAFVQYLEDPFLGIGVEPGESIVPRQRAIGQKLKMLAAMRRRALVAPESVAVSGIGTIHQIAEECERLCAELNDLTNRVYEHDPELGKFFKRFKKKYKKIGKKVAKVVKSPAFLSVAALAANFIPVPGVGTAVSLALVTAAKSRAAKLAAEGEEPDFLDEIVTATALPVATSMAFSNLAGEAGDLLEGVGKSAAGFIPGVSSEDIQKMIMEQAKGLVPGLSATGEQDLMALALKGLGQSSALDNLAKGTGLAAGLGDMTGGGDAMSKILDMIKGAAGFDEANEAGEQDIKNMGAATGTADTVNNALDRGRPSAFPVVPVAVGGGLFLTVILILVATGR